MVSWRRGKCIGKGSFGTVHLAKLNNPPSDAVFAVKSVDLNGSTNQLNSLEDEIRFLRSLSSPYIVNYLNDDVSYEETTTYRNLHMEYMPGGSVINTGRVIDEKLIRSCTWCIVSALKYIHAMGIVHCDVKGRNVLVGSDPGSAKLADFGSAIKFVSATSSPIRPRGSPLWMAPEVIRGEYQGPESDVWSLGCTVIEMVTGKPAWEDRGAETIKRIGFSDEAPEFPSWLSDLGRDFLEKCLRRDFRRRWSCNQLLQHPFLSSTASNVTITESSPRSVLDWLSTSEFEEDCESESISSSNSDFNYYQVSVKDRIRKLATETGANWESDNWLAVRDNESECDACQCETSGGETQDHESDWVRGEVEEEEEEEKERVKLEIESCSESTDLCELESGSGGLCGGANRSSPFGSAKVELATECLGPQMLIVWFKFCHSLCSNFMLMLLQLWNSFTRYTECICSLLLMYMLFTVFQFWPQFVHVILDMNMLLAL